MRGNRQKPSRVKIIVIPSQLTEETEFEFVERKGLGHPDTLADGLAEKLSFRYSNYTLKRFGVVLHHNFDKVGLLGGASFVRFGKGYLTKPIKVLLNGRASMRFGSHEIPIRKLLSRWTKEFFKKRLPLVDADENLDIHLNISTESSPGKTYEEKSSGGTRQYWFAPRNLFDLKELRFLAANDTSLGVGYAPRTKLENLVLRIEKVLNAPSYRKSRPWLGSDIKILGFRYRDQISITMCVPQIANFVKSAKRYKRNLETTREKVISIAEKTVGKIQLSINTRDDFSVHELYLTASGSSIESGDEGLVGRGNRITQIISPNRPHSMEGAHGKNPVYHVGKIYYIAAQEIAKEIYRRFAVPNEVYLASQAGRDLKNPWIALVVVPKGFPHIRTVQRLVVSNIRGIPTLTSKVLRGKLTIS